MNWNDSAAVARYADGAEAAARTGRYQGATSTPECPHRIGTHDAADWWDGFADVVATQLPTNGR